MSHSFSYILRTSTRAKNLSIRINQAGEVIVTKPKRVSTARAEFFITRKADWIISKIAYVTSLPPLPKKITRAEYLVLKEKAQKIAEERVQYFNNVYNFSYKRISIKNQKTRWGSCSAKGNLNFNYKIALLAPELVDYIIVHELCHLEQMNHSAQFWNLVAKTIPEYKKYHGVLRHQSLHVA